MRPSVFLDRDDTLIRCNDLPAAPPPAAPGDLVDPGLVELVAGVREGCERLARAGFVLVVVSNQGAAARGAIDLQGVERVNDRLRELLPMVSAVYYCPFHPRGRVGALTHEHAWRKPGGGMISAAAAELGLDLSRSWLIGDAERDVQAGIAAGLAPHRCVLVGGGVSFGNAVDRVAGGAW